MATVPTSAGETGTEALGAVLMHEHVFVRTESLQWNWPGFGGWDTEAEVASARERLTQLKRAGVDAIVDMTVPGLGRDPELVARAAAGTGVRVLFATGFFAPDGLPALLREGGAADGDGGLLESLFERDLTAGMGGTGLRAAVLSMGTGARGMTPDGLRVARAVAAVSSRTGAPVCTRAHAPTRRGLDQQRALAEHGADLKRVLIGGCSESTDLDYLEALLDAGSFIGWDRCGHTMDVPLGTQLDTLAELCWRGHARRVMLSHDRASFTDRGEPTAPRLPLPAWQYATIHREILRGLRDRGVPDDDVEQILVRNPREFLGRERPGEAGAAGQPAARQAVRLAEHVAPEAAVAPGRLGEIAAPAGFTGRQRELAELRRLARDTRLLTLRGAPGTGKSALLGALLPSLADEFADGAFLVEVSDLRQPGLLAARVAAVLGVSQEPGIPLADTLAAALRGRRLVLALDGCDQLLGACAVLCLQLLASAPGLVVLAASRQPLGVAAETVWPVPPLSLPAAGSAQSDAMELFAVRAAAARPGPADDGAAAGVAVAAICRAVGGLPLAIELAAARLRVLGAGQVAAGLADWFALPGPGSPDARDGRPARHRVSQRAVIDWVHHSLNPAEQVLLRRLSVFAGWSLEMAERVCADDDLPASRIGGLLAELAATALVTVEPVTAAPLISTGTQGRYRMPGAVRDYAAARLAEAGETEMLRRRLRDYVAYRAEYVASIGTGAVPATWPVLAEVFRTYDTDADNVRAALAWCAEHGDSEGGLRICAAVRLCWLVRGELAEGAGWLDAFLAAAPDGVPAVIRGQALIARSQLALSAGDLPRAESWAAAGLEVCRAAGDPRFPATALDVLARVMLGTGRPAEALRYATEAIERAGNSHDWWNRGFALGSRASALAAVGQVTEAQEWAQAGLALMLEIDNQWGAALFRLGLGDLTQLRGDLAGAREQFLAALPFIREVMPAPEAARCLARLGGVASRQGDLAGARDYLADSLRTSIRAGSRSGISRGLLAFAGLAVREKAPGRAVMLTAAATALCQEAGLPPPAAGRTQKYRAAAAGLGEAEVGRLWAAGLELSGGEAARLALDPPAISEARPRR